MKMACSVCGEIQRVGEKCIRVTCGNCLLTREPSYEPQKIIWKDAQKLRDNGTTIRKIAKHFNLPKTTIARHTVPRDEQSYA